MTALLPVGGFVLLVGGAGLLWFALPLTALGLGLTTWRVLRPART